MWVLCCVRLEIKAKQEKHELKTIELRKYEELKMGIKTNEKTDKKDSSE